ncbi:MAG TPA: PIG-L family deacetylase [Jatrophihabitans sp.]|nr:PIG-L family deacetylase [Jatrophihabitans sp.]
MTAAFRHDSAGTPESGWTRQPWLRELPSLRLPPRHTSIVVLAAHPDDESLGAGGLIAAAADAGHRVVIVIGCDGEGSHPDSTVVPDRLRELRRAEAAAAAAELGPDVELVLLGLPDGLLSEHLPAISQAAGAALGSGPAWLVTPWQDDGHPDHAACDRAGRAALSDRPDVRQFGYPIWWWHWAEPAGSTAEQRAQARRFELSVTDQAAKRAALACYRSQSEPLGPAAGDQPVLTAEMLSHFERDFEVLFDLGEHPARHADYFAALYSAAEDPWGLAERYYERRKRDIVLASLPGERFGRVFEPGCANGELSVRLAERSDELVCLDVVPAAVERARARLAAQPHVRVGVGRIPVDWPAGSFDLIVLSEVGYYCPDLAGLADRISASLAADGSVLLVHWRWPATDHPHTAETVHATIQQRCRLAGVVEHVEADFLLQVLSRSGRSVAQQHRVRP